MNTPKHQKNIVHQNRVNQASTGKRARRRTRTTPSRHGRSVYQCESGRPAACQGVENASRRIRQKSTQTHQTHVERSADPKDRNVADAYPEDQDAGTAKKGGGRSGLGPQAPASYGLRKWETLSGESGRRWWGWR